MPNTLGATASESKNEERKKNCEGEWKRKGERQGSGSIVQKPPFKFYFSTSRHPVYRLRYTRCWLANYLCLESLSRIINQIIQSLTFVMEGQLSTAVLSFFQFLPHITTPSPQKIKIMESIFTDNKDVFAIPPNGPQKIFAMKVMALTATADKGIKSRTVMTVVSHNK